MCSIFAEAWREGHWNVCDTMQNNIFFQASSTPDNHKYNFPGQHFYELFWKIDATSQLHGVHFLVNAKTLSQKGVILCFHGNAGTIAQWGLLANVFTKRGYDILMIDYRTFGKSKGELTEKNLHFDALLSYEYLKKYYVPDKIYIHGISIGTGVAIRLASQVQCRALVLQTPFFNLRDITQAHIKLPNFICNLLKFQFESDQYIEQVKCPIYAIHSQDDSLIPYTSAVKLFAKIKHRKDCVLWLVDSVNHAVELSRFYSLFLDTIYQ